MSAPEHNGEHVQEQKSSVKIGCTAKGEAQPSVSVYEGTQPEEMERIRALAVEQYRALMREVRG